MIEELKSDLEGLTNSLNAKSQQAIQLQKLIEDTKKEILRLDGMIDAVKQIIARVEKDNEGNQIPEVNAEAAESSESKGKSD